MANATLIHTRRLRLRSWRRGDADRYDETCNTARVMRWLGGVQSRAVLDADVRYFINSELREGFTFWVVELQPRREFLGFCGIVRILERDCPFRNALEIGWRIRQDAWRHGYAYEAASTVLDFAFSRLSVLSVVSRASPDNRASLGLMTKLGMRRRPELDYRPAGETRKLLVHSITAEQWAHNPRLQAQSRQTPFSGTN